MSRLGKFVRKPPHEKRKTFRFFARKALSKLPFLPVRARLDLAGGEQVQFWWSYLSHENHPERQLSSYWGNDHGELRFLWKFVQPSMVFFDVGAYHGIYSLLAGLKMASRGQIVAFEPSPRERRRFTFHMQMNGVSCARLEPYAVSNHGGRKRLFTVESDFSSMNSLKQPPIEWPTKQTTVETVSLDAYLQNRKIDKIDLMKIDVEGGELEAFEGAKHLLTAVRPLMICEVLDWVTQAWGYSAREIILRLRREGYQWFDFRDDGTIKPHSIRGQYPEIRNYLAVPEEKLPQVQHWRRD